MAAAAEEEERRMERRMAWRRRKKKNEKTRDGFGLSPCSRARGPFFASPHQRAGPASRKFSARTHP